MSNQTSPLLSEKFVRLLKKDLKEVSEGVFNDLPKQGEKFYRVIDSDMAQEEFFEVGSFPDVPEFNGVLSYYGASPGFYTKVEPKEYAMGVQTERKFIDDNKWGVLRNNSSGLVKALERTKEKHRAQPWVNAFSGAFTYHTSEEGLSLCNSSHTTKSGVSTATGFDNAGTDALSTTSVAETWLAMRQFRDMDGQRIDFDDSWMLIVPDALGDRAEEIAGTVKGLDTAEGNINPQEGRYMVERYMRLDDYDANNWFMVNMTMMKKFLIWINRIGMEVNTTPDFDTFAVKHSIYSRYAYAWLDWRWIFGHQVS